MRAAINEEFGGPEVLEVRDIAEPHARPGQLRVRVSAAGLNPMDRMFIANEAMTSPASWTRSVMEWPDSRLATAYDDITAAALDVAARTAAAALAVIEPGIGDTLLVGGAAGGVGTFAVQLARIAGARVIGTASEKSFEYLRGLGAEPVKYGDGLGERVRMLASSGVTAATDLFGTETANLALELGVPAARISMIAGQLPGVTTVAGFQAVAGTLEHVAALIAEGKLKVPLAATYPIEQIREAVTRQAGRHVQGKVVVTL